MITVCCVCNKVKTNGGWVSCCLTTTDLNASHGYCPECFAVEMEKIKQMRASKNGKIEE